MLLLTPYVTAPDGTRDPFLPAGTPFGQWTGLTDVYVGGAPRRTRRACVWVDATMADLQPWLGRNTPTVRVASMSSQEIKNAKAIRAAMRAAPRDKVVRAEHEALRSQHVKPWLDEWDAEDRAAAIGAVVRSLFPLLSAAAASLLAHRLGLPEFIGVPLLGINAGTTTLEDLWSGSAGADVHGRTADTTNPGGGVWQAYVTANGVELDGSNAIAPNGASASANDAIGHTGASAYTDQFAETYQANDRNNSWIAVRVSPAACTGYGIRGNAGRVSRFDGASGSTTLASGAGTTGAQAARLEAIGTNLYGYVQLGGSYPTGSAWTSTSDPTYGSGSPGVIYSSTGALLMQRVRGGTIGGATYGFSPVSGPSGRVLERAGVVR